MPIDVHRELRAFLSKYPTQKAAAQAIGVSQPFLHDVVAGHRRPSGKILAALGLTELRVVSRVKTER